LAVVAQQIPLQVAQKVAILFSTQLHLPAAALAQAIQMAAAAALVGLVAEGIGEVEVAAQEGQEIHRQHLHHRVITEAKAQMILLPEGPNTAVAVAAALVVQEVRALLLALATEAMALHLQLQVHR